MNAQLARELSTRNADKRAEENLNQVIQMCEKRIRSSAEKGAFQTSIVVIINKLWINSPLAQRLGKHFREQGFSIEIQQTIKFELIISFCW